MFVHLQQKWFVGNINEWAIGAVISAKGCQRPVIKAFYAAFDTEMMQTNLVVGGTSAPFILYKAGEVIKGADGARSNSSQPDKPHRNNRRYHQNQSVFIVIGSRLVGGVQQFIAIRLYKGKFIVFTEIPHSPSGLLTLIGTDKF